MDVIKSITFCRSLPPQTATEKIGESEKGEEESGESEEEGKESESGEGVGKPEEEEGEKESEGLSKESEEIGDEVKESMEEEGAEVSLMDIFDDIVNTVKNTPPSESVLVEFKEMQALLGGPGKPEWRDLNLGEMEDVSVDPSIVNRLLVALKNWKLGWEEVLKTHGGDELELDEYIGGGKFWLDEERTVPKNDVVILADASGSMRDTQKHLKQSLIILGRVMSWLKIRFAIYVFQGDHLSQVYAYPQKWGPVIETAIKKIVATGGTPLDEVYRMLEKKLVQKPKICITLTDGIPCDENRAIEEINKWKRRRIQMVAFYVTSSTYCSESEIVSRLESLGYERCAVINGRNMELEFPIKVLKLIVG